MSSADSKLDYLINALDFHLFNRADPVTAWHRTLEDYAAVYIPISLPDDGRTEVARAAERTLKRLGEYGAELGFQLVICEYDDSSK